MNERVSQVLARLELSRSTFWNISPDVGLFLNMLVQFSRMKRVLEIGTSNGYSGIWFSEALSHTDGLLYTIESHKERFSLAAKHFQEAGLSPFVHQLFGHAPEIFEDTLWKDIQEPFDLIFLDATKMEYEQYFYAVLPRLAPTGIMIADNALSHEHDLQAFFRAVAMSNCNHSLLPLGSGLLLLVPDTASFKDL